MNDNTRKAQVIFALNQLNSDCDISLIMSAGVARKDIKKLVGAWEGVEENSYMIPAEMFNTKLANLCAFHNQQAVMYLDNQRNAHLSYRDSAYSLDGAEHIGAFTGATKDHAKKQQAYTFDPSTGNFYIVC